MGAIVDVEMELDGVAVTIWTCMREVLDSNLGQDGPDVVRCFILGDGTSVFYPSEILIHPSSYHPTL
jgi:hypothetical protein